MTEIKVGDTVRIKQTEESYIYGQGNEPGVEFEVTNVRGFLGLSPEKGDYYVEGDPARRGVWFCFLEKVEPDTRWRYNDHIVVYPETRDQRGRGRGVTVLDEAPLPKVYTRWEGQSYVTDEITEAARAYWDAHEPNPVIKEAKVRGDYAYFAYQLRYSDADQWLANYTKADIDAALPVIDRLALNVSVE